MILDYGAQCPAYEPYTVGMGDMMQGCRRCPGRLGVYANGIDCGYSTIPTTEPKFNVGDAVHVSMWPNLSFTIRKREWDGRFRWVYYFSRERTPRPEDMLFATVKEAEEALIREKMGTVRYLLEGYCKRYGGTIESVTKKLLPTKEEQENG